MNVGIIGPKALIRRGLCALVSGIPGVTAVLDLDSSLAAVERLKKDAPDVLLVDSVDPATDFDVLSRAQALLPQTQVLVLIDESDEDYQLQAIRQGARGFVPRSCPPEVFERALKHVAKGELWMSHGITSRIIGRLLQGEANHRTGGPELSRREQEVLSLLADGYRNKEIASILAVSDNTVRAHVSSLYRKIHVTGRVEAALYHFERTKKNARLDSASAFSSAGPNNAENGPTVCAKIGDPSKHLPSQGIVAGETSGFAEEEGAPRSKYLKPLSLCLPRSTLASTSVSVKPSARLAADFLHRPQAKVQLKANRHFDER